MGLRHSNSTGGASTSVRRARTGSPVAEARTLAAAMGVTVRSLREAKGWNQEALAAHCGFFRTYLSRVETGRANPTLNVIDVLAKSLDRRASELLAAAEALLARS